MNLYPYIKMSLDRLFSLLLIILVSPLLILISILIKIDSPGKILFSQERVGKQDEIFKIYKFRSMHTDIERSNTRSPESINDKRLTRVGAKLRTLSLDELPQLLNILKGEMSFIGPRAITREEIDLRIMKYQELTGGSVEEINHKYNSRSIVLPGMTGLTQVNGRSNAGVISSTDLDYEYSRRLSIKLDFEILLKTFLLLIRRSGVN